MQTRRLLRRYARACVQFGRYADVVIGIGAGYLAFIALFGVQSVPIVYQLVIVLQGLLVLIVFPVLDVYETYRARPILAPAGRVIVVWFVTMGVLMVLALLSGHASHVSRLWLLVWTLGGAAGLASFRIAVYAGLHVLRRAGRNAKNVALVGDGAVARELAERVARERWMGYNIVARYPDASSSRDMRVSALAALERTLTNRELSEIWIVVPLEQGGLVKSIHALAQRYAVTVRYAPDLQGMFLLNHGITELAGLPMIDLSASPHEGVNALLKACEDWVLACIACLLAAPLMFVIAVAVKLTSRGPVLFKQRRHGWGGVEIVVYKFRTMSQHVENDTVSQAKRFDPRITPLGRFLRHTSLDELPQLINVLQGRMSLVGPRPHACEHNDLYGKLIDGYMLRHKVRPGITGWAQVNGLRGETETLDKMKRRIDYDLFYIDHWSLWLDVKILFMTMVKGFVNPNAY